MKYLNKLSAFTILFTFQLNAQEVGIGTENPQTTLDVAGDLNVSNAIHLGETPEPGTAGQFITSNGPDEKPEWTTIRLPAGMGESFSLTNMDSFADTVGQEFTSSSAGDANPYNMNDPLNASVGWTEFPGLSNSVTIYKTQNKINLHLQTVTQIMGGSGTLLASFGCGFFINDNPADKTIFRLKGVRTDVMIAPASSYKMFNMNTTIENLPPGEYTIKTACIKRNIGGSIRLGIGKALNTATLSSSMAQSTLNVYTLEKY